MKTLLDRSQFKFSQTDRQRSSPHSLNNSAELRLWRSHQISERLTFVSEKVVCKHLSKQQEFCNKVTKDITTLKLNNTLHTPTVHLWFCQMGKTATSGHKIVTVRYSLCAEMIWNEKMHRRLSTSCVPGLKLWKQLENTSMDLRSVDVAKVSSTLHTSTCS